MMPVYSEDMSCAANFWAETHGSCMAQQVFYRKSEVVSQSRWGMGYKHLSVVMSWCLQSLKKHGTKNGIWLHDSIRISLPDIFRTQPASHFIQACHHAVVMESFNRTTIRLQLRTSKGVVSWKPGRVSPRASTYQESQCHVARLRSGIGRSGCLGKGSCAVLFQSIHGRCNEKQVCISPWMIRISAIVLGGWAYTGWACCPKGSKGYNLKIKNPVSHGVRDSLKKKHFQTEVFHQNSRFGRFLNQ
jgi:hypothetical protein